MCLTSIFLSLRLSSPSALWFSTLFDFLQQLSLQCVTHLSLCPAAATSSLSLLNKRNLSVFSFLELLRCLWPLLHMFHSNLICFAAFSDGWPRSHTAALTRCSTEQWWVFSFLTLSDFTVQLSGGVLCFKLQLEHMYAPQCNGYQRQMITSVPGKQGNPLQVNSLG